MGTRFCQSFQPTIHRRISVWVEVKALQDNTTQSLARFLYENIMTRFGCPVDLVNDQASHVIKEMVQNLISMVNNFGFVVLFVLELLILLVCVGLLFAEYAIHHQ